MVKIKIEGETKEQKFKRIAAARTRRILNDLRLLGNCSNINAYSYNLRDITKIFLSIEREVKRVKALFQKSDIKFSFGE